MQYLDMTSAPAVPVRLRRSYTSFDLSDFEVTSEITTDGAVEAAVTVTNTGDRAGAEVVQLYMRINAAVVNPGRCSSSPGSPGSSLTLGLPPGVVFGDLGRPVRIQRPGPQGRGRAQPGSDLFVGANSDDKRQEASVQVTGERRILVPAERTFLQTVAVAMSQS